MINTLIKAGINVISPGHRSALIVLIYHRVLAEPDPLLPGMVDAELFESQLKTLCSTFTPIALPDAVRRLRDGTLPPRAACVSFDDGYADNESVALPLLRKYGVPATFFVASGYLDGGVMWNDLVLHAVRQATGPVLDAEPLGLGRLPIQSLHEKCDAVLRLIRSLKYQPFEERERYSWQLVEMVGAEPPTNLMMTTTQVRALHEAGMVIGAHTVRHPILANIGLREATREIVDGRKQLEDIVESPVALFAYPNGRPGMDFGLEHVGLVRALGFEAAVTTGWGAAKAEDDAYQLPRFTPWGRSAMDFKLRLGLNILKSRLDLPSPPYWEMTN